MLNRTFTCILCPNGCEITVEHENKQIISCTGNQCKNGLAYVTQELQDPRRTVTSSVLVAEGVRPMASVRLTGPIPRELIFPLMEKIKGICLTAPVTLGQVVMSDVFGYGCDLIITSGVEHI